MTLSRDVKLLSDELEKRLDRFEEDDFERCAALLRLHGLELLASDQTGAPLTPRRSATASKPTAQSVRRLRDLRLASGWWGAEPGAAFEDRVGTVPSARALERTLVLKCRSWFALVDQIDALQQRSRGAAVFALLHRSRTHLKFVGFESTDLVGRIQHILDLALTGVSDSEVDEVPLRAALLTTAANEWHFYFLPVVGEHALRRLFLQELLRNDALWPRGLNARLDLDLALLTDFKTLTRELHWPPTSRSATDTDIKSGLRHETRFEQPAKALEQLSFEDFERFVIDDKFELAAGFDDESRELQHLTKVLRSREYHFRDSDVDAFARVYRLYQLVAGSERNRLAAFALSAKRFSGWWSSSPKSETLEPDVESQPVFNTGRLVRVLVSKVLEYRSRTGALEAGELQLEATDVRRALSLPGVLILMRRDAPLTRYVLASEPTSSVLECFCALLNAAFEGLDLPQQGTEGGRAALAAALVTSRCEHWELDARNVRGPMALANTPDDSSGPAAVTNGKRVQTEPAALDALCNEYTLAHDTLWPHGLNTGLVLNERTLASFRTHSSLALRKIKL